MVKSEKKKKDFSKEGKKKKKKSKKPSQNQDFSKLTDAEYEKMFLEKFNEKKSKSPTKKQEISSSKASHEIQLNEIKTVSKQTADSNNSNNAEKSSYDVKMDFSWMDKPVEYVRHCPKCGNFIKSENSSLYNCPKCNTPMNFAIHCNDCDLWFEVKSAKKYPCPKCARIISH